MNQEGYSQITRTELMAPLRNLLDIRGPKEVPEKVDVRDVKFVADIFNTWAGYELQDVRYYQVIAGINSHTKAIVGENGGGVTFSYNTQGRETLVLSFSVQINFDAAGAAAHAGFRNEFTTFMTTGFPNYNTIPHSIMEVDTQGTTLQYIQSMGGFNNMANGIPYFRMPMYPWLPSGKGIQVRVTTNNNWPANTQLFVDTQIALVPKNGKLPSL